jgi:hypothetical protein
MQLCIGCNCLTVSSQCWLLVAGCELTDMRCVFVAAAFVMRHASRDTFCNLQLLGCMLFVLQTDFIFGVVEVDCLALCILAEPGRP